MGLQIKQSSFFLCSSGVHFTCIAVNSRTGTSWQGMKSPQCLPCFSVIQEEGTDSPHCQIYSRVAPLTWVKLLLICLSMGGSFALKKFAVVLVTVLRSERKRGRAGKEREFIVKWRGVGYWVKSLLCWIHREFSLGLHFTQLVALQTEISCIKREDICGCSFGWIFFSPCVSETLTMTSEPAGWFHPDLTEPQQAVKY